MYLLIYRHKNHYIRNLILPAISAIAIGWMLYVQLKKDYSGGGAWTILLAFIAIINLVAIVRAIKGIMQPEPVVVLNDEGITDKLKPLQPRTIQWNEIESCEIMLYRGTQQLFVFLKRTGAPVIINSSLLDYNDTMLRDTILDKIGKPRLERHLVG